MTTSVVQQSEDIEIKMLNGELPIRIPSHAQIVSRNGQESRIVVQDILSDRRYPPGTSKGFKRNQLIKADLDGDGRAEESLVVLFNLDIYAYDITEKDFVDPGPNIDQRISYNRKISRKNPVVVEFSLSDFHQAVDQVMESDNTDRGDLLGLYYFDPDSQGGKGSWYPIEDLEKKGELQIDRNGDLVILTIYEWPKDDRVHCGR